MEGDVEKLGRGFPVLKAFGDHAQSKRLDARDSLISVLAIRHDARQGWYLGEPPTVIFLLDFNRERHRGNVPFGRAA